MRKTYRAKFIRYLFASWSIDILALVVMFYVVKGSLNHDDLIVVFGTSCVTGAVFFHFYDFWLSSEANGKHRRHEKTNGMRPEKTV